MKEFQEISKKANKKAIYSKEECYLAKFDWKEKIPFTDKSITIEKDHSSGEDIKKFNEENSPITGKFRDDNYLFWDFRETAKLYFAEGELEGNLDRMIDKFKNNEGGIYEDRILTKHIVEHSNTTDFCILVEDYIAEQLKNNLKNLQILEDKEPYFEIGHQKFFNKSKGERNKLFSKPAYSYNKGLREASKGLTISLNDIWASEIILKEIIFENEIIYSAKYEVILWDHFGLDFPDIQKKFIAYPSIKEVFICWMVLQHLRGYKPFITKISFEKTFTESLQVGSKERKNRRLEKE